MNDIGISDEMWKELFYKSQAELESLRKAFLNEVERVTALENTLRDMPCFWAWYGKRRGNVTQMVECQHAGDEDGELPEHAWCPPCKARAAFALPAARDGKCPNCDEGRLPCKCGFPGCVRGKCSSCGGTGRGE